ncbi:MAG: restriction endonuclease subunit S [Bacteroides sp.]|nr:restriction endonuclease subunit S [Bacteroides sp.]
MEEWKEYKLGDICTKIGSGATPKGGKEAYLGGNISLIRSQNVLDFAFSEDGLAYINDEQANKLKNVEVKENDVLLNITGDSVARACIVPNAILPARVNQHVAIIRGDNSVVLNEFILYALQYKKQYLLSISQGGGTRNALTKKMIEDFIINLPPLSTQQKIANILSSLDDKIEVNRRINEQLEELAQALFKSWFVDFEPFKDGEFVESELGMIPKGWKVGTLGDVAMITKGTTPTTLGYSFTYNGIPFIKAESIRDNHTIDFDKTTYISSEANEKLCRSIIKKYDILFTIAGTLGRFCFAPQTLEIANTNQAVAIIRVHKLFNPISIYSMLLGKWHTEYCYRNIQQAVQANLSLGTLKKMPILIPPFDIIKKYEECIFPIFMKFESLNEEIHHLTTLRDTLLPKLMSGEIDVNEVKI